MTDKSIEKMMKNWGKQYKKGFTPYFVLLLLCDNSMYGYEITSALNNITKGEIKFQESGVYQIFKKLSQKKFVTSKLQKSQKGPQRKYYSITKSGKMLIKEFTRMYTIPINRAVKALISR